MLEDELPPDELRDAIMLEKYVEERCGLTTTGSRGGSECWKAAF